VDKFKQLLGVLTTYVIVTFAWIFFRSETIKDAFLYVQKLNFNFQDYLYLVWIIPIAILVDILVQKTRCNKILYPILAGAVIAAAMSTSKSEFIYFQF
jgi:D-alanyl-lipoteichoic acid acyltransferase DltB (MBOAT superfamily)